MSTMPRFMRNRVILMALGPSIPWLAWIAVKSLWITRAVRPGLGIRLEIIGLAVYIAYIVLFCIYMSRWRSRFRRRLAASGGLLCFRCGYGLEGLKEEGACPECGEPFVASALRERWIASGLCERRDVTAPQGA